MNNMLKNLVIWLVIGLVLMTVFNQFNTRQSAQAPMEYSQFLEEVKSGRIAKVTIEGRQLKATTVEGNIVGLVVPEPLTASTVLVGVTLLCHCLSRRVRRTAMLKD